MPCSAVNAANRPCGISTKSKFCHVHIRKMIKLEKDAKLAYKVSEQTKELKRLNDVNSDLNQKIKYLINQVDELNILRKEINKLKDENDLLLSMKEDYDSYQTIRNYERLHRKMSKIYNEDTARDITRAMKAEPSKCFEDLGYTPWKRFNRLRFERNAAAHLLNEILDDP